MVESTDAELAACGSCDVIGLESGTTGGTFCRECGWSFNMRDMEKEIEQLRAENEQARILTQHGLDVQTLLKREVKMVNLIVGPKRVEFQFNRDLLCYYSGFFEGGFYGGFKETESLEMELPEDDPKCVEVFGAWAQTGVISLDSVYGGSRSRREVFYDDGLQIWDTMLCSRLWVFGNKILSKKFCNSAMWLLLEGLSGISPECVDVREATYIFENTVPKAKLRAMMFETIQSDGPFTYSDTNNFRIDWEKGMAKGGELIEELEKAGGFSNEFPERTPEKLSNRHLYYEVENEKKNASAIEWRKGKREL